MKLFDYLEGKTKDVSELKDLSDYTIIIFDLETNGLIGSQGLKVKVGEKWDNAEKRYRGVYDKDDLHIAEIGAISYNFKTKRRDKFHTFVKANLDRQATEDKTIKELISWDDVKEASAKPIKDELKRFNSWLNKFPKKIIVAHNGISYDFKVMKLIANKFGMNDLESLFTNNDANDSILVDTKKTTALRKELINLPWPTGVKKTGGSFEVNNQNALINMFGINNANAHTAIEDVKALGKYLIKISKELRK